MDSINIICNHKQDDDFIITGRYSTSKALDRVIFNRNVNSVLKLGSAKLNKHILSHSFRISLITDLIDQDGIENTQDYIGHKNINTTKLYRRRKNENQHYERIINIAQKERASNYKKIEQEETKLIFQYIIVNEFFYYKKNLVLYKKIIL